MSIVAPGTLVRFWTGLVHEKAWLPHSFEHCLGMIVSSRRGSSPYVNRGTFGAGHDTCVLTSHGYVYVFMEDDDERYLWNVV